MSLIDNNALLQTVRGMFGKTVVFRQFRGKIVMASPPKKRTVISEKQQRHLNRFESAKEYARKQMAIPEAKAEYQKRVNDRKHSAYAVAISDYFHAPKIHHVDATDYKGAIGDIIEVKASDDFTVTAVKVIITNQAGVMLEEGHAVEAGDRIRIWEYRATVANEGFEGITIKVTAMDKPGNETVSVVALVR